MSGPLSGPHHDTSRSSSNRDDATAETPLTLPPFRSLDLAVSRSTEQQSADMAFRGASTNTSSPQHSAQSVQPAPRDGAYRWRGYGQQPSEPSSSANAPSSASSTSGPMREAQQSYRPAESSYSPSFLRETRSPSTSSQHAQLSPESYDQRFPSSTRRVDSPYQSPYPPALETTQNAYSSGRTGRGSTSHIDSRGEYRQQQQPHDNNHSPSFIPIVSAARPASPSLGTIRSSTPYSMAGNIITPNPLRGDEGSAPYPHYSSASDLPLANSAPGGGFPTPTRPWPERSYSSSSVASSPVVPRMMPGPGQTIELDSRRSSVDRWPTAGGSKRSAPQSPVVLSALPREHHNPQSRRRDSPPTTTRAIADMSSSIAEIVSHCVALTNFAKQYGENVRRRNSPLLPFLMTLPPRDNLPSSTSFSSTLVPLSAECQIQGRSGSEAEPSPSELQQMVRRATAVAQLLDSLRIARITEENAKMMQPPPSPSSTGTVGVGTKRSWDVSQGVHPRPLKLIFETGQGALPMAEPSTAFSPYHPHPSSTAVQSEIMPSSDRSTSSSAKAIEDLDLIKRKRHAVTGVVPDPPVLIPKPKKRGARPKLTTAPPGQCASCGSRETPEWRRGPDGPRTLCNACGLHYAKVSRDAADAVQFSRLSSPPPQTGMTAATSGEGMTQSNTGNFPQVSPLPTGPSPSTRLAPTTLPLRLSYPGDRLASSDRDMPQ